METTECRGRGLRTIAPDEVRIGNPPQVSHVLSVLGGRIAMHEHVRGWIVDVLARHQPLLAIAFRQRAKFEGWLKFELAACAEESGATSVCVETASEDHTVTTRCRSDLASISRRFGTTLS